MNPKMAKLDYSKVDPWVKKNPEGNYHDFIAANPKVKISTWSFEKRRRTILNLPLTPSMQPGYRGKTSGEVGTRTKSTCVYNTVFTIPSETLKNKTGQEVLSELVTRISTAFNLHLEVVELIGNGVQMFEIRRYTK